MSKRLPVLCVAAWIGLLKALPQETQVPFSITINAETNVFKAGSEIRIRLVFKNTWAAEIPCVRGSGIGVEAHGERFTNIEVRDAKGEMVPETRNLRALRRKPETSARPPTLSKSGPVPDISDSSALPKPQIIRMSSVGYMLKPGETREEDIVVSKLYDLTRPGRYSISTSRRLGEIPTDPNYKLIAKSNTLIVTIIE